MRALFAFGLSVVVGVNVVSAQTTGDTAGSPIPAGVYVDGGWVPCTHPIAERIGFSCAFYGTLTQDMPVANSLGRVWHHTGAGWQQQTAAHVSPPTVAADDCGGLSVSWIEGQGEVWSDGRSLNPYAITAQEMCAVATYHRAHPLTPSAVMELEVGTFYTDVYQHEVYRVLARITPTGDDGRPRVQYVIQWRKSLSHQTAAVDLIDPPAAGTVSVVAPPPS